MLVVSVFIGIAFGLIGASVVGLASGSFLLATGTYVGLGGISVCIGAVLSLLPFKPPRRPSLRHVPRPIEFAIPAE